MARLIYLMNTSADGFIETPDRSLDWTKVDDELHTWFNDQLRSLDATLYGRRMYELMSAYWPTSDDDPNATQPMLEFGRIWRPLPKIVFSKTLDTVDWNSRLVRGEPAQELARVRTEFDGDIGVAGATLAASFIRAGLVDEFRVVVHPVIIGGGLPYFPALDAPLQLRLEEMHRFGSGVVYLRYTVDR
jgi:dihydrofolate reductase